MSLENLKEYARRCAAEPELLARARELGMTDLDGHMREAGGLGLKWDMDDMIALRKEVIDADGEFVDLDEKQLEDIAGGLATVTAAVVAIIGFGAAAAVGGVAVAGFSAAAGGKW